MNFEGKSTYDLSVPCEWAQYKLYKNAWIVGIGPSKQKLWLMELEQITTKPFAWTLIYTHELATDCFTFCDELADKSVL